MPYEISSNAQGCDGYAVIKPETGEVTTCHSSKADAVRHIRALYANVPDAVAKSDNLQKLHDDLHAKYSEPVNDDVVLAHHFITSEMTKRGINHGHDNTGWGALSVVMPWSTFVTGVDLDELEVTKSEVVDSWAEKWELTGDELEISSSFGVNGEELLIRQSVEDLNKVSEETTWTPTNAVAAEAKRALGWIREGKQGGGFTAVGRARAAQLAGQRPVSLRTLQRMASYFRRHKNDSQADGFYSSSDKFPSPGRVAWDAWGGDAGKAWAERIIAGVTNKSVDEGSFNVVSNDAVLKEDEKRFTLAPLYIPNSLDAHNEWTDPDELQKAVWDYVKSGDRRIRLQHNKEVIAGEWLEVMTFPYPLSIPLVKANGESNTLTFPANTVFMGVQWSDWAWKLVKEGKLRGYSIGGKAQRILADIEEDDEDDYEDDDDFISTTELEVENSQPTVTSVHVDTIMNPNKKKKIRKEKDISVGDVVLYAVQKPPASTTYATAEVERIERSGVVTLQGTQEKYEASADDPVAVLRVWAETDSGLQETNRRVVKPFSQLRMTDKKLEKSTESTLRDKVKEHNDAVGDSPSKRTTVGTLLQVYRRGVGAYRTNPSSVRPNVTSEAQWAFGRVNGFLHALRTGGYKRSPFDTDLLPESHPLHSQGEKK
jgi:hypothetical protein